jgi:hypothetical protein
VRVRRIATAATTIMVAIVVALAVPVSQLRTMSIVTTCCCPDPAHCHCPDHQPDRGKPHDPSMRACHRSSQEIVAPQLPSFTAPEIAIAPAPMQIVALAGARPTTPHLPPLPLEPYGPS